MCVSVSVWALTFEAVDIETYFLVFRNLILSQISLFTHIYKFADFNGFVDLQILADFQI